MTTPRFRWVVASGLLLACSGDPGGAAPIRPAPAEVAKDARSAYARIVLASYEDSLAAAEDLDAALVTLVEEPSEESLSGARRAWLEAREPFMQTEAYRFYGGPIDGEAGLDRLLNAWPLDESIIDYVADDAEAGIVNDSEQLISAAELESLNLAGGETSVTTGYHALEFLLWGEDRSDEEPGDRPHTDYVTDGSGTADHQERRGEYLLAASELLGSHLETLIGEWRTGASNYRTEFVNIEPLDSVERMVKGVRMLCDEIANFWLSAPLESADDELEQSDFSDDTKNDVRRALEGVRNVWSGSYERLDGTSVGGAGLDDVVRAETPELAERIELQLAESLDLAGALEQPFEREIAAGNPDGKARIEALIDALEGLCDELDEAMDALALGD